MKITPKEIITQARTWLGTKYHHQGRLKKGMRGPGGVDCIGLLIGVIDELGIKDSAGNLLAQHDEFNYSMYPERGRLVSSIAKYLEEISPQEMREGDVLLFKFYHDPQHVGLLTNYPGGGLGVIHCTSSSGWVVEQPFSTGMRRMLTHIYRLPLNN